MFLAHEPFASHGGWWFLAPLFWIGAWILIIMLFKGLFFRRHWRRHHHNGHGWGYGGDSDPRNVLAQRFARGEINEQEYRERLAVLNPPKQ